MAVDPDDRINQLTAAYFAVAILGLFVIFTAFHIVDLIIGHRQTRSQGAFTRRLVRTSRYVKRKLLQKVPGFPTLGHALVFIIYVAINLALIFHRVGLTGPPHLGKRMGWITACNISLVTFLAIKNTPLAFLTSYSYERLNILHQAAGCCTVISVVLHAILQLVSKAQLQALSVVVETPQIMAIVAGLSLLTTFTAAVFLRPVRYEAFYIIHVVMFMLVMIGIGMHRPNFSDQTIIVTLVTACIWVSDRLIRALRLITLSVGNHATLTPLGQRGVRISMHRTPWRTTPGSHVFLCIPKIRSFEVHPFTVVSTNLLELVVSARDGFTRDLLSHATANPGATLRASCDGPYGAQPNFSNFDQVVLIAGGSGASFTFGVALHLVRRAATAGGQPKISFTWVIRDHEFKKWFEKELAELAASQFVTLTVYITRSATTTSDSEKDSNEVAISQSPSLSKADPEKAVSALSRPSSSTADLGIQEVLGRPDIEAKIRDLVAGTEENEKTIVAACGPDSLMTETREVVAGLMMSQSRSVALHCEKFGW